MALRGKGRRPIEDRLAIRFPALATHIFALLTRVTLRMPRRWRLRQLLIEFSAWRAYNALGRGDLAVLRTVNHADVVWDLSRWGWPEASLYHGRDGVVRYNELWVSQWSELNFDVVSIEELEERGLFLLHLRLTGIGRASGVEAEQDNFTMLRMRDGLVWRGTFFRNRAEAIEGTRTADRAEAGLAAGLHEG